MQNSQFSDNNNMSLGLIESMNNQSCLVDSELVQCLEEINEDGEQAREERKRKRKASVLRRSSIETADFYKDKTESKGNNKQTIDAESNKPLVNFKYVIRSPEINRMQPK